MLRRLHCDRLDRRVNKYCLVSALRAMKEKGSRARGLVEVLFYIGKSGRTPVR